VQGKLLELVEKVETLETLGERGFLLQTDSPVETLSLRWEDIDWEENRISIPEPKVKHHEGRGIRSCPIFPEQRPTVTRASEPAPVSSGCQHDDGQEELEPTHRDDTTLAPRRRLGLATIVPFDAGQPANGTAA